MAYGHESENASGRTQGRRIGEVAIEAGETIGTRAQQALDNVPDSVKRSGRDAAENAQQVVGNFRDAMEKSTRENPLTTVLMAAAIGFLVGTLWR